MNHLLRYLTPDVQARFDAKFVRGNPDECWPWLASKTRGGYGQMRVTLQNRVVMALAHRISWTLSNQADIPDGLCVMHFCDNPECINPEHLSVGTNLDNRRDSVTKLRHQHGERHGLAKLTEDQVIAIFFDPRVQTEIAADFGVSRRNVRDIKAGRRWRHLALAGNLNIGKHHDER